MPELRCRDFESQWDYFGLNEGWAYEAHICKGPQNACVEEVRKEENVVFFSSSAMGRCIKYKQRVGDERGGQKGKIHKFFDSGTTYTGQSYHMWLHLFLLQKLQ